MATQIEKQFKTKLKTLDHVSFIRVTKKGFYCRIRINDKDQTFYANDFKQAKEIQRRILAENPTRYYSYDTSKEIISDRIENFLKMKYEQHHRNNSSFPMETYRKNKRSLEFFNKRFGNIRINKLHTITEQQYRDWHFEKFSEYSRRWCQEVHGNVQALLKQIIKDTSNSVLDHAIMGISKKEIKYGNPEKEIEFVLREQAMETFNKIKNDIDLFNENPILDSRFKITNRNNWKYGLMTAIYLQSVTGMRSSESFGIRWNDIVAENGKYHVYIKGQQITSEYRSNQIKHRLPGEYRRVPISKRIFQTIMSFKDYQNRMIKDNNLPLTDFENVCSFISSRSYLKENPEFKPYEKYFHGLYAKPEFVDYLKNLKPFKNTMGFHKFRHGFAIQYIIDFKGLYTNILQSILGHKRYELTEHYTQVARNHNLIPEMTDVYVDYLEQTL
jgi:integrase